MKTIQQLSLIIAGLCLASGALVFSAEKFQLPPETAKLKSASGVQLATAQCLLCHSADYISTQPRLSRTAWTAAVVKMKDKYGAPIQTNNIPALVDYLSQNYGVDGAK
jgi:hypothetical protein